ncbi:hypothetical protein ABE322_08315 [Priestia megaterium]
MYIVVGIPWSSKASRCSNIITCSSQEEQEQVYANWWLAIEKAGGKTRKAYEKEQEAIAKRHREWKAMKENKELDGELRALGI